MFARREFLKVVGLTGVAAACTAASAAIPSLAPIEVGNRKQLFIDRRFIQCSRGIELAVNPPEKAGPVLLPETPWERKAVDLGYLSVEEDGGLCKMWYLSGGYLCYATSKDGIAWNRPVLNVIEFEGSRRNNIVLKDAGEGGLCLDPVAPPNQRFKTLAAAAGGHRSPLGSTYKGTLVLVTSPDGIHWKEEYQVLPFHPDSQNNLFWDERLHKYVAYLRAWDPLRSVARCEIAREDILKQWLYTPTKKPYYLWSIFPWGKDWPPAISTELPIVLACDEKDGPCDVYTPNVRPYPYAEDVYLAFPSIFRHTAPPGSEKIPMKGMLDVQMAVSRNGIFFDRLGRVPYLGFGLPGQVDSHQLYCALGMIRRGNQIYQYYSGCSVGHASSLRPPQNRSAVLRAVQRLDGFVSANANYDGGEFSTPLLRFQGRQLRVNIDTSTGGTQVEVRNSLGLPVPGLELRNCPPIVANDVEHVVRWNQGDDISGLQGQPIQLRFQLRSTRLFAFQFV